MSSNVENASDDAIDVPVSREQRLEEYNGFKEVLKGIEEIELNDNSADMDDTELLIAQANKELERLAESLNAEEDDITPTANLLKVLLPNKTTHEHSAERPSLHHTGEESSVVNPCLPQQQNITSSSSSSSTIKEDETSVRNADNDYSVVILYPPASDPRRNAPYEVLFDNRDWYSCVITEIVPPSSRMERIQYKAWILGYNVEEVVCYEELRRWMPGRITSLLISGTTCHIIHPHTGRFVPAVVERLTLDSTAMVRLESNLITDDVKAKKQRAEKQSHELENNSHNTNNGNLRSVTEDSNDNSPSAEMASMLEVPLSHVRVGKIYERLMKRPQLTDDERAARRVENMKRRREKIETRKQFRADQVAQDANDWKSLMCDMMGSDRDMLQSSKKRRRI